MSNHMAITVYSVARYRAFANEQKARGLKVGGTMTIFCVSDGTSEKFIDAYGPTPGARRAAAIRGFINPSEPMVGRITTTYREA